MSDNSVWRQRELFVKPRSRGFHLITNELVDQLPELKDFSVGLAHFFIQHTSAALTINENADPSVRDDFENWCNAAIPEQAPYWTHTLEGPDDMPAHIKSSLFGCGLTIPVTKGRLALGTWQGIYLCEHRNFGGTRSVVATLWGSD